MTRDPVADLPSPRSWRHLAAVCGLFIALTLMMTWPQIRVISTHSVDHQDIFFNLWRLRWIHHALTTSPATLFDGNQFHPERGVLAYSDAMLVEGLIATPLLGVGLRPVLVHNLLHLGAFAASGIGMFVLARYLTSSAAAAILAGVVFAFAPYRFAHFMHMELQWTMWIPWAFWSLQRTFDSGRSRFGVLTGLFIALQMLSSIYYAIFLVILLAVAGAPQWAAMGKGRWLQPVRAFAGGAVLAVAVAWIYSAPYREATLRVGARQLEEIQQYSATAASYRSVPEGNWLYGKAWAGSAERSLFPGVLPCMLAVAGLLMARPSAVTLSYLAGLLVAVDLSFGVNGLVYPYLYAHVPLFSGLRSPARAAIFLLLFLGVLAARGGAAVLALVPARGRGAAGVALIGIALLEYQVAPLRLIPYPNDPPPLYSYLAQLPAGVVAELPMPDPALLPGSDARYVYTSTFHWRALVNGYSGYYPPSYLSRLAAMKDFPTRRGLDRLRADGVRYIVVHEGQYTADALARILEALTGAGAMPIARLYDGWANALMFELR